MVLTRSGASTNPTVDHSLADFLDTASSPQVGISFPVPISVEYPTLLAIKMTNSENSQTQHSDDGIPSDEKISPLRNLDDVKAIPVDKEDEIFLDPNFPKDTDEHLRGGALLERNLLKSPPRFDLSIETAAEFAEQTKSGKNVRKRVAKTAKDLKEKRRSEKDDVLVIRKRKKKDEETSYVEKESENDSEKLASYLNKYCTLYNITPTAEEASDGLSYFMTKDYERISQVATYFEGFRRGMSKGVGKREGEASKLIEVIKSAIVEVKGMGAQYSEIVNNLQAAVKGLKITESNLAVYNKGLPAGKLSESPKKVDKGKGKVSGESKSANIFQSVSSDAKLLSGSMSAFRSAQQSRVPLPTIVKKKKTEVYFSRSLGNYLDILQMGKGLLKTYGGQIQGESLFEGVCDKITEDRWKELKMDPVEAMKEKRTIMGKVAAEYKKLLEVSKKDEEEKDVEGSSAHKEKKKKSQKEPSKKKEEKVEEKKEDEEEEGDETEEDENEDGA
ncbi:TPA_asm: protein 2 [Centaurea virus 1]|uniref:Protein 2 n=1 Tax=Centaurea virus 1 TaxID=2977962 RepID=A0A9N6YIW0_9RHAB|nr:TPA_asm: protein 2 [Centaurea virus 1]